MVRNYILYSLILFLLTSQSNIGQNIDNYYTSLNHEEGTVFFINPIKGFRSTDRNDFIYDITADTSKDSVIFNFSYFDKRQLSLDSIRFNNNDYSLDAELNNIFIETERSKFHYRKTANMSLMELKKFFVDQEPKIFLYSGGSVIEIGIRRRAWRRQSSAVYRILTLVELNK